MAELQRVTEESVVVEEQNTLLRSYLETDGELRWLTELRLAALDRFSHMQWPTPQEEEWRRTDVTEIEFSSFWPASGGRISCGGGECAPSGLEGQWRQAVVAPLPDAARRYRGALSPLYEEGLHGLDNRFQAWHYSLLSHGLYIQVPAFMEIEEPLLVEFHERGDGKVSSPHLVIRLEEGARATVVVYLRGEGEGKLLLNGGADLVLAEGAALNLVLVQELNQESLYFHHESARVGRDGMLRHTEVDLGAALVKTRIDCSLDGPGAEAGLNGLFFAKDAQHMDIRTVQRHRSPRANSRAFYKGAVRDSARTIYQGLIEVCPAAAKTDAYLSNKNLILNDGARADSIPSLRIETNDVRCSHGSTTGRINQEEVFYLTSRGLSPREARRMLIVGYFEDLLERIPEKVRGMLRERIEARVLDPEGE